MTDSTTERTPLTERIAAAPISWGVCEVPGWGWQHEPPTVLTQMRELGIAATEFGPDGFLPDEPEAKAATLASYQLTAVGQFVPVVLHDAAHDPLPVVESAMTGLVAADATTVVIAAATGVDGYDERPDLDEAGWSSLLRNLDRIDEAARARGLRAVDGLGMLLHQGRPGFAAWFGVMPEVDAALRAHVAADIPPR